MKKQEKEILLNGLKSIIEQKKKACNSLDSDAKALMEESIKVLQDIYDEAEAAPDEMGVDTIVDKIKDALDDTFATFLEKVKALNPQPQPEPAENYLKSRNSFNDFAKVIRNSRKSEEFRKGWRDALSKNGITITAGSEGAYLPEAVKSMIEDTWNASTDWMRDLDNTGAKRYALRFNSESQDTSTVRALGHKKGDQKTDQEIELGAKIFDVQAIYKKQTIDKETIYNDDESLVRYVIEELTKQVRYEIGRAILVGDGRSAGDPNKINSIESVLRSTTDAFVTVSTTAQGSDGILEYFMEELIKPIYDGEPIFLFLGKDDLFELRKHIYAAGGTTMFASVEQVREALGVEKIIVLPYLSDSGDARAVALQPKRYKTVGDMDDFTFVQYPDWDYNQQKFLCETFVGGGCGLNAGAVIPAGL
ncbi:MAG: phage major capsid protein [Rikenellaceae bacterium]|nr:phage major capsid protein [Rikenellaceae bacterium]